MTGTDIQSLILDVIPIAALILLMVRFFRDRYLCRLEEQQLREKLSSYEQAEEKPHETGKEEAG